MSHGFVFPFTARGWALLGLLPELQRTGMTESPMSVPALVAVAPIGASYWSERDFPVAATYEADDSV